MHPHFETITDLRGLNTDLAFVVTVQAKCHPHHAVKAALVAMPEPHHRDLPQIERPGDVQLVSWWSSWWSQESVCDGALTLSSSGMSALRPLR